MSRDAEQLLRAAVHDLAGSGPSAGPEPLARAAIRRGRWIRRRRRAGIGLVVILAIAATTAPHRLLSRSEQETAAPLTGTPSVIDTVDPDWTTRPLELPGGWIVLGASASAATGQPAMVFDRHAGRYRDIAGFQQVVPSPDGDVVAVTQEGRPRQIGLLDLATDEVRWFETGQHILEPQWSPDGSRLLVTISDKDSGEQAFATVAAADGVVRTFPVDISQAHLCTDVCRFTWARGGDEVALSQTDPGEPRSESLPHARRGIQFFSPDDGRPTRFLPIRGDVVGPWSFSPDDRQAVVKGQHGAQLVDTGTGEVRGGLPSEQMFWVGPDRLLDTRSNGYVELTDLAGDVLVRQLLPDRLTGTQLSVGPG
ncbi:hypothetical protein ACN27F_19215 [Solwaraspora sp. WMMB335]|uniref:hypothetical protein n=1 Tax=Solwaraspora sp. WMMB335 TaxID=3404118 RepID=UPI003B936C61